jgi:hypothetical protein
VLATLQTFGLTVIATTTGCGALGAPPGGMFALWCRANGRKEIHVPGNDEPVKVDMLHFAKYGSLFASILGFWFGIVWSV